MHDHDFEKQVQQKMDELKMSPSGSVWERVEKRLQGKEKRRPWLLWLPLFIGMVLIGVYLFLTTGMPSTEKMAHQPRLHEDGQGVAAHTPQRKTTGKLSDRSFKTVIPSGMDSPKTPGSGTGKILSASSKTMFSGRARPQQHAENITGLEKKIHREPDPAVNEMVYGDIPEIDADSGDSKILIKAEPRLSPYYSTINTLTLAVHDPVFPGDIKNPANVRWEWGLSIRAGKSGLNNGKMNSFFRSSPVADAASNFSGGGMLYRPPSQLKAGFGFSGGIYIRRKMTDQLSVSAGLNYNQFTTSYLVGEPFDSSWVFSQYGVSQSAREQYYRRGNSRKYINRYHFIELPVVFDVRLFSAGSIPLSWKLGFSLSELVASNSLYYDSGSGLYSKSNTGLNKTQFNALTGLTMRFFSNRQLPLEIGPQLQYGLTRLLKNEITESKHLLFFSLEVRLPLGRK